jgi:hypothetical protein
MIWATGVRPRRWRSRAGTSRGRTCSGPRRRHGMALRTGGRSVGRMARTGSEAACPPPAVGALPDLHDPER